MTNICIGSEPSYSSYCVGLRSLLVILFYFVAVMSYIKPHVHMNPQFKLAVDWPTLREHFKV